MPNKSTPSTAVDDTSSASGLPLYMHLRGRTYYFKRKLPTDVAKALSKKEQVWKSLKTTDLGQATKALAKENAALELQIEKARARPPSARDEINKLKERTAGTTKYLVGAHIPVLLDGYEYAHLSMDDDERKLMTREDRRQRLEEFEEGLEFFYDERAAEDFSAWEDVVDDLLKSECLIAPPNSAVRLELLHQLALRDIEILETQCIRLKGKGRLTSKAPPSARGLPTMRDIFDAWKKKQSRTRTIGTYDTCVAEFEALHGALPVAAISPLHARDYRDWLLEEDLMQGTAENRIGGLATLFRFGQTELTDHLMLNPFVKVDIGMFRKTASKDERRGYAMRELKLLLNSKLYTENFHASGQTKEALYWAPLLGPFVGARIEEIAQLRFDDIKNVNGVWTIHITERGPDQTVKTDGSSRRVPMHQEIIACGFLAYVARKKQKQNQGQKNNQKGNDRIFPSLRNDNKNKVWSGALTTRYGRYLDEIELSDPRLDYHSFRYTFRQQCTICGVDTETRDALTGHWLENKKAGRTYLKEEDRQYPFPALERAIGALQYVGLDLSHLYVSEPLKDVESTLMT